MVNLAIYVRVSTSNQTYFRQIDDIKSYINSIYGTQEVNIEVYAENISGFKSSQDRPELTRFLEKVKTYPTYYKCLYLTELSRVGRNPIQARETVIKLLEQGIDVCVTSTNGGSNFLNPDGTVDKTKFAVLGLLMDFAQIEIDVFKDRTASGLREKVMKGGTNGGLMQPYGYRKDENKKLVIDEDESIVIKMIFELYSQGEGMGSIAKQLNKMNVQTRTNKAFGSKEFKGKDANNIKWTANQIYVILNNSLYYGERVYKKRTKTRPKDGKIIDLSEKFDSPQSKIISKELFEKCTDIRLEKKGNGRNITTKNTILLQYITTCGTCGRNYTHRATEGSKNYLCSSRVVNTTKPCGNKGVSLDLVDSAIYDVLCKSPTVLKYLNDTDKLKVDITSKINKLKQSIPILENELKFNSTKIERLLDSMLDGIINKERFSIKNVELASISKRINTQLDIEKKLLKSNEKSLDNLSEAKLDNSVLMSAKEDRNKLKSIFQQVIKNVTFSEINYQFIRLDITLQINGVELDGLLRIIVSRKGMRKAPYQYQYQSEYIEPFNPADEDEDDYYYRLHNFKKYDYNNKIEYDNIVKNFITIDDNIITIN